MLCWPPKEFACEACQAMGLPQDLEVWRDACDCVWNLCISIHLYIYIDR